MHKLSNRAKMYHRPKNFLINLYTPHNDDTFQMPSNGQERYWLSSKRIALVVPADVHLWTQISHGYLSLQAQTSDSPYASFPVRNCVQSWDEHDSEHCK